jgi:hypothetical protein
MPRTRCCVRGWREAKPRPQSLEDPLCLYDQLIELLEFTQVSMADRRVGFRYSAWSSCGVDFQLAPRARSRPQGHSRCATRGLVAIACPRA